MQAYNFSLDGLSHGFSTIEFRLLSEQSEYCTILVHSEPQPKQDVYFELLECLIAVEFFSVYETYIDERREISFFLHLR